MIEVKVLCRKNSEIIGRVPQVKAGWVAYDDKKRIVGRVVSVFGPVSEPYVKIRLKNQGGRGKIYVGGAGKWRKKKKRRNG
jgi:rRNA processing protein Gar1